MQPANSSDCVRQTKPNFCSAATDADCRCHMQATAPPTSHGNCELYSSATVTTPRAISSLSLMGSYARNIKSSCTSSSVSSLLSLSWHASFSRPHDSRSVLYQSVRRAFMRLSLKKCHLRSTSGYAFNTLLKFLNTPLPLTSTRFSSARASGAYRLSVKSCSSA